MPAAEMWLAFFSPTPMRSYAPMKITNQLFDAFVRCKLKFHLLATGQEGVPTDYDMLLQDLDRTYREEKISHLRQQFSIGQIVNNPPSILEAQSAGPELMLDVA